MKTTRKHFFAIIAFISIGMVCLTSCTAKQTEEAPKIKYVFLFIGDGMGLAHVALAEAYLGMNAGDTLMKPLAMSSLPVTGLCRTYCHNKLITCSAAAGTALASGQKTAFGVLGKNSDKSTDLESIATKLHKKGYPVGIVTTVSIDHATPAAFYAHSDKRNSYYDIGLQLCESGFPFFAGGGFRYNTGRNNDMENLLDIAVQKGYSLITDSVDVKKHAYSNKSILINKVLLNESEMPLSIDRARLGGYSMSHLLQAAIAALYSDKGFFIMAESGLIDWAAHYNDAASIIHEVIDFDKAIGVALEFMKKHPDETLIVVTADHETGGMSLGMSLYEYDLHLQHLNLQRISAWYAELQLKTMLQRGDSFDAVLQFLRKHFFAENVQLSPAETQALQAAYNYATGKTKLSEAEERQLYGGNQAIAAEAVRIVARRAGIGFSTYYHTASPVPVFAAGKGAEVFGRFIDNTDVPLLILGVMGE